jgi:hypothetical protein
MDCPSLIDSFYLPTLCNSNDSFSGRLVFLYLVGDKPGESTYFFGESVGSNL